MFELQGTIHVFWCEGIFFIVISFHPKSIKKTVAPDAQAYSLYPSPPESGFPGPMEKQVQKMCESFSLTIILALLFMFFIQKKTHQDWNEETEKIQRPIKQTREKMKKFFFYKCTRCVSRPPVPPKQQRAIISHADN